MKSIQHLSEADQRCLIETAKVWIESGGDSQGICFLWRELAAVVREIVDGEEE